MLLSGITGALSSLEWVPTMLFVALAVIYVILPSLGYRNDQRNDLVIAMYLVALYDALTLLNGLAQYLMSLGGQGGVGHGLNQNVNFHVTILIGLVKAGLLLGAKLLTISCLKALEAPARRSGVGSSSEIDLTEPTDADAEANREFHRAVLLNNQHHRDEAIALLQQIIANYPKSRAASKARSALRKLDG